MYVCGETDVWHVLFTLIYCCTGVNPDYGVKGLQAIK